jgi:hypothetical protein
MFIYVIELLQVIANMPARVCPVSLSARMMPAVIAALIDLFKKLYFPQSKPEPTM